MLECCNMQKSWALHTPDPAELQNGATELQPWLSWICVLKRIHWELRIQGRITSMELTWDMEATLEFLRRKWALTNTCQVNSALQALGNGSVAQITILAGMSWVHMSWAQSWHLCLWSTVPQAFLATPHANTTPQEGMPSVLEWGLLKHVLTPQLEWNMSLGTYCRPVCQHHNLTCESGKAPEPGRLVDLHRNSDEGLER